MVFNDVTERIKQADIIDQQLADLNLKNKQLEKYIESNLQLENFAYIASHDLKSPIRSVRSFVELLINSAEDKLDEKENKFLQIINDSSRRMQELIDDLLIYSRVNTNETVFVKVNPQNVISEIIESLSLEIKKSNAEVAVENIPETITADLTKIKQVLHNLISNAIKFHESDVVPKIQISAREEENKWTFNIEDNGIGIDESHIDKIFLLFQKLHSKDKYEGTGLGLAICKKILDQHKGEIWVTNNTTLGCTFSFSIPKNPT